MLKPALYGAALALALLFVIKNVPVVPGVIKAKF